MTMSETTVTRSQKDQMRPKPFFDTPPAAEMPVLDVSQFAPTKASDDVEPAKGRDLAGKAKVIFVIGRGKTGKTTLLRWMAERALDGERPFLMADIDPTNASFSSYFSDVARPDSYDPGQVKAWLQRFIAYALEQKVTAIIDLGGGDTVLRSLLAEMPAVFAEIEGAGLVPVAYYMCGPQPDDLAPVVTLKSHGFAPAARALVFNEGVADAGLSRRNAFAEAEQHPIVATETQAGALVLWMPKLFAAATVENRRAAFAEVRDGRTEKPVNLFDRARVRSWLEAMDHRFGGVSTWLP
jgi:hypothetical protein